MALVYDNTKPASKGGGYINWDGPLDNSPGGWLTEYDNRRKQAAADLARSQGRWKTADKFAFGAAAIPFAAAAAPLFAGVGGAGASAAGAGSVNGLAITPYATAAMSAPGIGSGLAAGASRLPWMAIGSKGADTLFGLYANHQQSKANKEALAYQQAQNAQAVQIERDQLAEQKRQFDIQQQAAKDALAAQNKFEADKWAASEDERLYNRRLQDEHEARLAPRRALAAQALTQLPRLIASGSTSPGLGSLGSYRR